MASTLCQNGLEKLDFCQKTQNFMHIRAYNLVQILPACGPNTYQIMSGETLDSKCQYL